MSNYKTFSQRVKTANSIDELKGLEIALVRLYNASVFTVSQFKRLDSLILDKYIELE